VTAVHYFLSLLGLVCFHHQSLQCFDAVVVWQKGHLACKKPEWWGAGVGICLGRSAADAAATHCLLLQ